MRCFALWGLSSCRQRFQEKRKRKKNGKYGYIDKNKNVIVDYIYDDAKEQNNYGYSAVKVNNLWGVIDKMGKLIVEPKYELKDNLVIDFINKYHLGRDINLNYYTDK